MLAARTKYSGKFCPRTPLKSDKWLGISGQVENSDLKSAQRPGYRPESIIPNDIPGKAWKYRPILKLSELHFTVVEYI
jgi:hypothetical protein